MNQSVSHTFLKALEEVKQPKQEEPMANSNVGITNILETAKDTIAEPKTGFVEIKDSFCILLLVEERHGDSVATNNSVRFISTTGNKGVFTTIFHYLKKNYLEAGYYLFDMRYNKEADALKNLGALTVPMILLELEAQGTGGDSAEASSYNLRFYLDKNTTLTVDE